MKWKPSNELHRFQGHHFVFAFIAVIFVAESDGIICNACNAMIGNGDLVVAYLEGRDYVLPEDIKEVAPDVMNHRLILNYEAEADNVNALDIIKAILNKVPIGK